MSLSVFSFPSENKNLFMVRGRCPDKKLKWHCFLPHVEVEDEISVITSNSLDLMV